LEQTLKKLHDRGDKNWRALVDAQKGALELNNDIAAIEPRSIETTDRSGAPGL
jgi:hypothetical protein